MGAVTSMDKAQQERHNRLIEQMRRILGSEICAIFEDPNAVEIMLNDDGKILIERHGSGITELTTMPAAKALNFLGLMADFRGTTVSREKPIVEGAMPDEFLRARFAGAIPPLMPMPTFSIRLPARSVYTLADYVASGIILPDQRDTIVKAVEDRKNILVSGGTGCFAKGHPVLMFDGSIKAVEDVVVGDQVMGPDLQARVVKDVHSGLDFMVEVVPVGGVPFRVNEGHALALVETHKKSRRKQRMTVMEWTRQTDEFRHTHKLYYAPAITGWAEKQLQNVGIIPTRIPRKRSQYIERDVLIRSITSLGIGVYYGFEVDHPDHLFVDGHFMVQGNSGKTTLLNALSDHIAQVSGLDQRIVIIEDTREIVCNAPNTVSMLTDADTGIDMTRLLKLTLRYRPDRIFVGEVRDGSALALLKAWNTGHPGGLATLHANNPESALIRLDQLCQEANVPPQPDLIHEAVNLVLQIQRDPSCKAGRRITHIFHVKGD